MHITHVREIFVSALTKEVLGPRNGINEVLKDGHNPIIEYITGILSPEQGKQCEDEKIENLHNSDIPENISKEYEDDDMDYSLNYSSSHPSLNPEKIVSNMGISFQVSSPNSPEIDVCITWARYIKTDDGYKRTPRYTIRKISNIKPKKEDINSCGKICEKDQAEISFVPKIERLGNSDNYFITIFIVNAIKPEEERSNVNEYIFQPQIRISCAGTTELAPMTSAKKDTEDLYRKRQFFAKGHMTSAVWWDIDPENTTDELREEFESASKDIPFKWIDSDIIPESHVNKFSKPDVRTEYVPLYSIPAPKTDWPNDKYAPVLEAEKYAEMWDSGKIQKYLNPILEQYESWISELDNYAKDINQQILESAKKECSIVLDRMKNGVNELVQNEDVRLAFCFANKAIAMQYEWMQKGKSEDEPFKYRPFQLAFILMSLESIINPKSKYRNTCDLLWIPTGAGKTEAYLVLVAISIAYRRLKALKCSRTGVGTDVISRYTLRLLTIQQFRRSLSLFTAAEKLRVDNIYSKDIIGWRPKECSNKNNLLWGSTPFSVGLWVGRDSTPNNLEKRSFPEPNAGAIELLKDPTCEGSGEPAQILECPACKNLLAITEAGLPSNPDQPYEIHWVVKTDVVESDIESISLNDVGSKLSDLKVSLDELNSNYKILVVKFKNKQKLNFNDIVSLWKNIEYEIKKMQKNISCESTSPLRPGYFYKTVNKGNGLKPYDFQIFCTKKDCPLSKEWLGGSVSGEINGSEEKLYDKINEDDGITLEEGNQFIEIIPCFQKSRYISLKIPINALTVDEQIYSVAPTMIIATVDKFARLPFKPEAGIIFGNAKYHHPIKGYSRDDKSSGSKQFRKSLNITDIPSAPSLIIQDELHLLEGPLGSMTGIYESCIDFLSKRGEKCIKYIASTATIKNGEEHIRSLFAREAQIFPPRGVDVDDRFFIKEREEHVLADRESGRLYMGIMATGKGSLTPIIRIWSRLAQTGFDNKDRGGDIDRFWTITGYFNAVRELAGTVALYGQDIQERMKDLSPNNPRPLGTHEELSSRAASDKLPTILNLLEKKYPGQGVIDALFTTSMFGTGVDISRIGLMLVNGQPKTISSYIQSTGRIGRREGGLVPIFFRASKPRDLSHYEYFIRNHRQLHRHVESTSVNPFSSGVIKRALGPIIVGMLRNMRQPQIEWDKESPIVMKTEYNNKDITELREFIKNRSQNQPDKRKPEPGI